MPNNKRASLSGDDAGNVYSDALDRFTGNSPLVDSSKAPNQQTSLTPEQQNVIPFSQQDSKKLDEAIAPPELAKATFYLRIEDILAIDRMQSAELLRTRKKPDRSELVRRAIQLLAQQEEFK